MGQVVRSFSVFPFARLIISPAPVATEVMGCAARRTGIPICSVCGGDSFRFLPDGRVRCLLCSSSGSYEWREEKLCVTTDPGEHPLFDTRESVQRHADWLRGMKDQFLLRRKELKSVVQEYTGHTGWAERFRNVERGIGIPFDDINLFVIQLPYDGLDTHTADTNTGTHRINCRLESSNSHMSRLARQEMYFGKYLSMDDIIKGVDKVTAEQSQRLAQQLFTSENTSLTILGPLNKTDVPDEVLEI